MLTRRNFESGDDACIHEVGIRKMIVNGKDLTPVTETDVKGSNGWNFQHIVGMPRFGGANCLSISLILPETELKTPVVDFFTPEVLDEITRSRPSMLIQLGSALFVRKRTGWVVDGYSTSRGLPINYRDVYEKSLKYASGEELRNVVHRGVCDDQPIDIQHECPTLFELIESLTGTQVPREEVVMGIVTKEDIKTFLTFEKLESIDFSAQMKKLEKEVEKSEKNSGRHTKVSAMSRNKINVTSGYPQKYLRFIRAMDYRALIRKARSQCKQRPERLIDVLFSTQIADTFPQGRQRQSKRKGISTRFFAKSSTGEVSPRQITDFLLVNSSLAVTNTKYSDILAAGAMHKLQRLESPIFAVCADKITWEPQLPPTGSSSGDWLSSNYRFKITGFKHSSFEYRKLSGVDPLYGSSQCAILALVGVAEEGFKDLTRRPFDIIFGILESETIDWQLTIHPIEGKGRRKGRPPMSAAVEADPWILVPKQYSSSLTLGQLFDQISESLQENGSPDWPDDAAGRSLSKRRRSSRGSESQ